MIVMVKPGVKKNEVNGLIEWLKRFDVDVHVSEGEMHTILGLVGDTTQIDMNLIRALAIVEDVKRIQEPFKKANRKFHPDDTVVEVGDVKVGAGHFLFIAGPCSVESKEQITGVAADVKKYGAHMLRGGAYKPRTSPYSFQGLHEEGIELLLEAKKKTGLPIVSELMDLTHLKYFNDVDVVQVGARNMQNFEMLKALGHIDKPVLLKRGLSSTLEELLMSAEYVMSGGNERVILCERGIRTFESYTRNTLDISAVPMLKSLTHLPVIIDPSHATGISRLVRPMCLAAAAAGADGLIVEVHNDPEHALCDGPQSITPEAFKDIVTGVGAVRSALSA